MKTLLVHYGPGPTSITKQFVDALKTSGFELNEELDLVENLPDMFNHLSMSTYVKRNYKQEEVTLEEEDTLKRMDFMAEQLLNNDSLILVTPMYNFSVPAAVKAWIDSFTQAKKLFKYTEYGPVGLSNIKKAIIIPVTGNTKMNSSMDFLTPLVKVNLEFVGIKDIEFKGLYGARWLGDDLSKRLQEIVSEIKNELQ